MSISYARDVLALAGLGAVVAGTWIVAGLGVALLVLGAVLLAAGSAAAIRGGDA